MESYDEFCLKALARVHAESGGSARHEHTGARSAIRFHGSHALLPRLTEQQRVEMAEQRQRAVQRECERHTLKLRSLHDRVQDVMKHIQLQKEQDDDNQAVEAPCSKRTQTDEQTHTSIFLNHAAQRKETLRILNSQIERVRKQKEEKEKIQTGYTGEIQIGSKDLRHAEMQRGKKKESEKPVFNTENGSCRTLKDLPVKKHRNSLDYSADIDSRSPDSLLNRLTICASIMQSSAWLPSPPIHNSSIVPIYDSEGHSHRFPETVKSSDQGATISEHHPISSSEGCNCSGTELTKTNYNLPISSNLRSLTLIRPIDVLNTTQKEILKKMETQQNHCKTRQFSPGPLNQSYDVESPSPTLLRSLLSSGSEASETIVRRRLELKRCLKHRINQERLTAADTLQDRTVGNVQVLQTQCERVTVPNKATRQEQGTQQQQFQEQQKAASRLTASARGFLTRRLLQTEKMKHLKKTIQNSRDSIRFFQADTYQRRASFTMQDLKMQQRVRAQLHAALDEVHEIFFVWHVKDRMVLLQQDRKLHSEMGVGKKEKEKSEQKTPCQSQNSKGHIKQRVLQPTRSREAPTLSQKLKPVRVMRRTAAQFRSPQSLG